MADEVALGFAYLTSTLAGDATLTGLAPGGIRRSMAPPTATTPFVIMRYQSGTDAPVFGGGRSYSDLFYEIKVYGPASGTAALVDAAARISTLISTAVPVAVTGGTIKACSRSQAVQQDEEPDGSQWSCFGGIYRMFVTVP